MIFNIFGKTKGIVEEGSSGSEVSKFRHACPLHERCGIADCGIGDVHATHCARYPFLKEEVERTGRNQAQM